MATIRGPGKSPYRCRALPAQLASVGRGYAYDNKTVDSISLTFFIENGDRFQVAMQDAEIDDMIARIALIRQKR